MFNPLFKTSYAFGCDFDHKCSGIFCFYGHICLAGFLLRFEDSDYIFIERSDVDDDRLITHEHRVRGRYGPAACKDLRAVPYFRNGLALHGRLGRRRWCFCFHFGRRCIPVKIQAAVINVFIFLECLEQPVRNIRPVALLLQDVQVFVLEMNPSSTRTAGMAVFQRT